MAISLNGGTGVITGVAVGGLPDGIVDADMIASGVAGKIVQVVNSETGAVATGTTTTPNDDTIPQITEGDQFLSLAITPTSSSNKLIVEVIVNAMHSSSGGICIMGLYNTDVHSTNSLATSVFEGGAGTNRPAIGAVRHYLTAPSTSATTFTVRIGGHQAGTTAINASFGGTTRKMGGSYSSSITITEIAV